MMPPSSERLWTDEFCGKLFDGIEGINGLIYQRDLTFMNQALSVTTMIEIIVLNESLIPSNREGK